MIFGIYIVPLKVFQISLFKSQRYFNVSSLSSCTDNYFKSKEDYFSKLLAYFITEN